MKTYSFNSLIQYQKTQKPRLIAILTIVLFCFTSFVSPSILSAAAPITPTSALVSSLAIPKTMGTIQKIYTAKNKNAPFVIHIQDAHANYEAQKNIEGLLEILHKEYGVNNVQTEGCAGEVNTSLLRAFPLKQARTRIVDRYVKEGMISGPEAYAITCDEPIMLTGIDNEKLYLRNVRIYAEAVRLGDEAEGYLSLLESKLMALRTAVFTTELYHFVEQKEAFLKGNLDAIMYTRFLIDEAATLSLSMKKYPVFSQLIELERYQKNIDSRALDSETRDLIDNYLLSALSSEDTDQLALRELDFHGGRSDAYTFYYALRDFALKAGVDFREFKNINLYLNYISLVRSLDAEKLMQEREKLEEEIFDTRCTTRQEKEITEHIERLFLLKNIFSFQATPRDIKQLKKEKKYCTTDTFINFLDRAKDDRLTLDEVTVSPFLIEKVLPLFVEFYELAEAREKTFVQETKKNMHAEQKNAVVLFTGGYHTAGIEKYLEKEDMSYCVIAPRLTEIPKENLYDKIMRDSDKYFGVTQGTRGGTVKQIMQVAEFATHENRPAFKEFLDKVIPDCIDELNAFISSLDFTKSSKEIAANVAAAIGPQGSAFLEKLANYDKRFSIDKYKQSNLRVFREMFVSLWNYRIADYQATYSSEDKEIIITPSKDAKAIIKRTTNDIEAMKVSFKENAVAIASVEPVSEIIDISSPLEVSEGEAAGKSILDNENFNLLSTVPQLAAAINNNQIIFDPGEAVLVRVNVNVTAQEDGTFKDTTRLDNIKEVVELLLEHGVTPVLFGHNGSLKLDDNGNVKSDNRQSLTIVAQYLQTLFPQAEVIFHKGVSTGDGWVDITSGVDIMPGAINVLENVRLDKREQGTKAEQKELAEDLAQITGAKKLIFDAFGDIGSKGSSIQHVPFVVEEVYTGPSMMGEFDDLESLLVDGYDALITGSNKLNAKMPLLKALLKSARKDVFLGAAFSKEAQEDEQLLNDLITAQKAGTAVLHMADGFRFNDGLSLDIDDVAIKEYLIALLKLQPGDIVIINGTMGLFETDEKTAHIIAKENDDLAEEIMKGTFREGTQAIVNALKDKANRGVLIKVIGGDSNAVAKELGLLDPKQVNQNNITTYTGGGVPLKILAGELLTGVKALAERQAELNQRMSDISSGVSDSTNLESGTMGRWYFEKSSFNPGSGELILKNAVRIPQKGFDKPEDLYGSDPRDITLATHEIDNEQIVAFVRRLESYCDKTIIVRSIVKDHNAQFHRIPAVGTLTEEGQYVIALREELLEQGSLDMIRTAITHEYDHIFFAQFHPDKYKEYYDQVNGNRRNLYSLIHDYIRSTQQQPAHVKNADQELTDVIKRLITNDKEYADIHSLQQIKNRVDELNTRMHELNSDAAMKKIDRLVRSARTSDVIEVSLQTVQSWITQLNVRLRDKYLFIFKILSSIDRFSFKNEFTRDHLIEWLNVYTQEEQSKNVPFDDSIIPTIYSIVGCAVEKNIISRNEIENLVEEMRTIHHPAFLRFSKDDTVVAILNRMWSTSTNRFRTATQSHAMGRIMYDDAAYSKSETGKEILDLYNVSRIADKEGFVEPQFLTDEGDKEIVENVRLKLIAYKDLDEIQNNETRITAIDTLIENLAQKFKLMPIGGLQVRAIENNEAARTFRILGVGVQESTQGMNLLAIRREIFERGTLQDIEEALFHEYRHLSAEVQGLQVTHDDIRKEQELLFPHSTLTAKLKKIVSEDKQFTTVMPVLTEVIEADRDSLPLDEISALSILKSIVQWFKTKEKEALAKESAGKITPDAARAIVEKVKNICKQIKAQIERTARNINRARDRELIYKQFDHDVRSEQLFPPVDTIKKRKRIGVLIDGVVAGDNTFLKKLTEQGEKQGFEVIGIFNSWEGLSAQDISKVSRLMNVEILQPFEKEGGNILGTALKHPLMSGNELQLQKVQENIERLSLDSLVMCGDLSSIETMQKVHASMPSLPIVSVPRSYSNDIAFPNGAMNYGHDSFNERGTEITENIDVEKSALGRIMIVEVAGGKTGHTALEIGAQVGATRTLIPEEDIDLNQCAFDLEKYYGEHGNALVMVSRGFDFEKIEQQDPEFFNKALNNSKDAREAYNERKRQIARKVSADEYVGTNRILAALLNAKIGSKRKTAGEKIKITPTGAIAAAARSDHVSRIDYAIASQLAEDVVNRIHGNNEVELNTFIYRDSDGNIKQQPLERRLITRYADIFDSYRELYEAANEALFPTNRDTVEDPDSIIVDRLIPFVKFLSNNDLEGKTVLLRLNLDGVRSKDAPRLQESLETIRDLVERGAHVIIATQDGRHGGRETLSLKDLATEIEHAYNRYRLDKGEDPEKSVKVKFHSGSIWRDGLDKNIITKAKIEQDTEHQIHLLDNLSFCRFEEGDPESDLYNQFADDLASLADMYVFDAFDISHKQFASTFGVASRVKQVAIGHTVDKEIQTVRRAEENLYGAILGGGSIERNLDILRNHKDQLKDNSFIAIGGASVPIILQVLLKSEYRERIRTLKLPGFSKMRFQEYDLTIPGVSESDVEKAIELLELIDERNRILTKPIEIVFPESVTIVNSKLNEKWNARDKHLPTPVAYKHNVSLNDYAKLLQQESYRPATVQENWYIYDVSETFAMQLKKATRHVPRGSYVFWDGVMGVSEVEELSYGTQAVLDTVARFEKQDIRAIVAGKATTMVGNQEENMEHVSFGVSASDHYLQKGKLPVIETLVRQFQENPYESKGWDYPDGVKRIGILTGGGLASGHNELIATVVEEAARLGIEVVGIRGGWEGLVEDDQAALAKPLHLSYVQRHRHKGGSILGTTRTNPFKGVSDIEELFTDKKKDKMNDALNILRNVNRLDLDALFTLGGDDTNGASAKLQFLLDKLRQSTDSAFAEFKDMADFSVVGLPKTMDNDIQLPGNADTYGYHTDAIEGARMALAMKREAKARGMITFVEAFGRNAGHAPLRIGKEIAATRTIIPEEGILELDVLYHELKDYYKRHGYGIVVASEGVKVIRSVSEATLEDMIKKLYGKEKKELSQKEGIQKAEALWDALVKAGYFTDFPKKNGEYIRDKETKRRVGNYDTGVVMFVPEEKDILLPDDLGGIRQELYELIRIAYSNNENYFVPAFTAAQASSTDLAREAFTAVKSYDAFGHPKLKDAALIISELIKSKFERENDNIPVLEEGKLDYAPRSGQTTKVDRAMTHALGIAAVNIVARFKNVKAIFSNVTDGKGNILYAVPTPEGTYRAHALPLIDKKMIGDVEKEFPRKLGDRNAKINIDGYDRYSHFRANQTLIEKTVPDYVPADDYYEEGMSTGTDGYIASNTGGTEALNEFKEKAGKNAYAVVADTFSPATRVSSYLVGSKDFEIDKTKWFDLQAGIVKNNEDYLLGTSFYQTDERGKRWRHIFYSSEVREFIEKVSMEMQNNGAQRMRLADEYLVHEVLCGYNGLTHEKAIQTQKSLFYEHYRQNEKLVTYFGKKYGIRVTQKEITEKGWLKVILRLYITQQSLSNEIIESYPARLFIEDVLTAGLLKDNEEQVRDFAQLAIDKVLALSEDTVSTEQKDEITERVVELLMNTLTGAVRFYEKKRSYTSALLISLENLGIFDDVAEDRRSDLPISNSHDAIYVISEQPTHEPLTDDAKESIIEAVKKYVGDQDIEVNIIEIPMAQDMTSFAFLGKVYKQYDRITVVGQFDKKEKTQFDALMEAVWKNVSAEEKNKVRLVSGTGFDVFNFAAVLSTIKKVFEADKTTRAITLTREARNKLGFYFLDSEIAQKVYMNGAFSVGVIGDTIIEKIKQADRLKILKTFA